MGPAGGTSRKWPESFPRVFESWSLLRRCHRALGRPLEPRDWGFLPEEAPLWVCPRDVSVGPHSEPDRGPCCYRPRHSCREAQLRVTRGRSTPPSPHTGCCRSPSADRQPWRTCCVPPMPTPSLVLWGRLREVCCLVGDKRHVGIGWRGVWGWAKSRPARAGGGLLGRLGGEARSWPWAHQQNLGRGGWRSQLLSQLCWVLPKPRPAQGHSEHSGSWKPWVWLLVTSLGSGPLGGCRAESPGTWRPLSWSPE